MKRYLSNDKGYTLIEIVIVIGLGAIVAGAMSWGLMNFRNTVEYDILLNQIVKSMNQVKLKATSSQLDSAGQRTNYSIMFLENKFVQFEGDVYTEGANSNIESDVSTGLKLSTSCAPIDNGIVTFEPIVGTTSNRCIIYIYKFENPSPVGTIVVGEYGVEEAN